MRQDQMQRLRELGEKLADIVLDEADPSKWPGAGTPLAEVTPQQRGDRYWCKKNAAATFTLLTRTLELSGEIDGGAGVPPQDMDKVIANAERQAEALLQKAMGRKTRAR